LPVLGYKELNLNLPGKDKSSFKCNLELPPFYPSIQNHNLSEVRNRANQSQRFGLARSKKQECDISNFDELSGFRFTTNGLMQEERKLRAI
jgi:hypothetical protein